MRVNTLIVLTCLVCLFLAANPGHAQTPAQMTMAQADSMPTWTVPVLRLVSATHVEPTTGVVLTDSGLVLVPLEFAGAGDEIIVLDGGTDIIRHGRPAKIVNRFPSEGLQVLSVESLRRRGASFSASPLSNGSRLRLSAFPPAEQIAQGAAPLDIEATLAIASENGMPTVSADAPLPNVSGALLDECGNLAGYSSAQGVQSMSTSEAPRYQWKDSLQRIMAEMQIEPHMAECERGTAPAVEDSDPHEEEDTPQEPEQEIHPQEPVPEPAEPETDEESADPDTEELKEEAELEPGEDGPLEILTLPPHEDEAGQAAVNEELTAELAGNEERGKPAWFWLLAAALLIGGGFMLHRIRNSHGGQSAISPAQPSGTAAAPDSEEQDEPGFTAPGLDNTLTIKGLSADGEIFELSCQVSSSAINLVIGRGSADISLDNATVSRRHASLNGTAEMLTLSDLGSNNGTSINGVPCLEGETMFVNPDDTIILGNCRFSVDITSNPQAAK